MSSFAHSLARREDTAQYLGSWTTSPALLYSEDWPTRTKACLLTKETHKRAKGQENLSSAVELMTLLSIMHSWWGSYFWFFAAQNRRLWRRESAHLGKWRRRGDPFVPLLPVRLCVRPFVHSLVRREVCAISWTISFVHSLVRREVCAIHGQSAVSSQKNTHRGAQDEED